MVSTKKLDNQNLLPFTQPTRKLDNQNALPSKSESIDPKLAAIRTRLLELAISSKPYEGGAPLKFYKPSKPLEPFVDPRKKITSEELVDRAIKTKEIPLETLIENFLGADEPHYPIEKARTIIKSKVDKILKSNIIVVFGEKPLKKEIDSQFELFFMQKARYTREALEALKKSSRNT